MLNWKTTIGLILLVTGLAILSVGVVSVFSLSTLNVKVLDVDSGLGVADAEVYLFEGGGEIEPPENATLSEVTDGTGVASFLISGFYRVGVIAEGYESASSQPQHAPSKEWSNTWTAWGAAGSSAGTYQIEVVTRTGTPDGDGDNIVWEEPEITETIATMPWYSFVGIAVAFVGCGFIAYDKLD